MSIHTQDTPVFILENILFKLLITMALRTAIFQNGVKFYLSTWLMFCLFINIKM